MRKLLLLLPLAAMAAFAAVDGTVVNQTTGKPQAGAVVTLFRMGQEGMNPLGSARTDAAGKFRIDQPVETHALLQVIHDGVIYNQMLGMNVPASGMEVQVFDASNKPGVATIAQHMVLLEPSAEQMIVSETFFFRNDSKLTFRDTQNGTLRFFLPEAAKGIVRVTIQAPGSVPIQRPAEKTSAANIYKVDYAVKPGETRFDLTYLVPLADPPSFEGRVLFKGGPTRLVVPNGVELTGDALESLGKEPSTQASIYEVKGNAYNVAIRGSGSLPTEAAAEEDDGAPGIQQVPVPVFAKRTEILGLTLAILAIGFALLYRSTSATHTGGKGK